MTPFADSRHTVYNPAQVISEVRSHGHVESKTTRLGWFSQIIHGFVGGQPTGNISNVFGFRCGSVLICHLPSRITKFIGLGKLESSKRRRPVLNLS